MKYVEEEIGLEVDLVKDEAGEYIPFEWRDVVGYKGYYQVSNYGDVKSLSRSVPCKGGKTRVIKSKLKSKHLVGPYYQVQLSMDGSHLTRSVHLIVYEAFHGLVPTGKCIDHVDRVKTNNHSFNLRPLSYSHNSMNTGSVKGSASRYKGVHKHPGHWKWRCCSRVEGGSTRHLGYFELEGEAAEAYNKFVLKERGAELAVLNDLSDHDWEADREAAIIRKQKHSKCCEKG